MNIPFIWNNNPNCLIYTRIHPPSAASATPHIMLTVSPHFSTSHSHGMSKNPVNRYVHINNFVEGWGNLNSWCLKICTHQRLYSLNISRCQLNQVLIIIIIKKFQQETCIIGSIVASPWVQFHTKWSTEIPPKHPVEKIW